MPKTRISEYSTTNTDNSDIEGINIAEGCAPSGINNAIRELMVHLKEFQTGASGDSFTFAGGTVLSGTNTISGAAIISGNINSSGSANTFSGGVVHSGTNTFSSSVIISGNINSSGTNTFSGSNVISVGAGTSASPSIYFASDTNTGIFSPAADTIAFAEGGVEAMRIDSSGNLLVGATATFNTVPTLNKGVYLLSSTNNDVIGYTLRVDDGANARRGSLFLDDANGTFGLHVTATSGVPDITFTQGSTERMRIDSSGNLLLNQATSFIGTNTADGSDTSKLSISGGGAAATARGGVIELNGNENADPGLIEISSGNVANSYVKIQGRSSSSYVRFDTNATERMRITSDGEVLVGGTTAISADSGCLTIQRVGVATLNLFRDDTTVTSTNVLGSVAFYGNDATANAATNLAYIQAVASGTHAAGDNPTDLVFGTTPDGTETVAEAGRITQSGAYVLKGGTTTAAAGVGIIFPATQVASANVNCLDDYEEGTWTPVPTGWTSITYATQVGNYTKIGNQVTAWFTLRFTGTSAASNVTITGLPFSVATNVNGGALTFYDVALNETTGVLAFPSLTTITLYADNDGGAAIQSNGNVTSKYLIGFVTYQV